MSEITNIDSENTAQSPGAVASPEEAQVGNNSAAAEDGASVAAGDVAQDTSPSSPKLSNKKPTTKRTPSKRMSFIERAQKESEELVKNMGGSLELEGGRRTRSSTRGTPTRAAVSTPPPVKKPRNTLPSSSTPSRARGRGRKLETASAEQEVLPAETEKQTVTPDQNAKTDVTKNGEESAVATTNSSEVDSVQVDAATVQTPISSKKPVDEKKLEERARETSKEVPKKPISETVPDKEQNNVDHSSGERKESPMETDEQSEPEVEPANIKASEGRSAESKAEGTLASEAKLTTGVSSTEDNTTTVIPTVVAPTNKQATPEPMEVDSSSNDLSVGPVESIPSSGVAKSDENASKTVHTNSINNTVEQKPQKEFPVETVTAIKANPTSITEPEKKSAEETSGTENNVTKVTDTTSKGNEVKSVPVVNSVDISGSGEPLSAARAATKEVSETDSVSENQNKTDNDTGEPKVASPSTQLSESESNPQYCN